jgi:hypothetical protein
MMMLAKTPILERGIMARRKIKKYEGRRYFSLREAAEYTGTSLGTLRTHVYTYDRISGAVIGKTLVFTRRQLDDYVANDRRTALRPDRFNISEAAAYLDIGEAELEQAIEDGRIKPLSLDGVQLFNQAQLDDFAANGRSDIVPTGVEMYGTIEAAEYAVKFGGIEWADPESSLKQHIYILDNLPVETVGASVIISHEALMHFIQTKRPRGRPPGSD